MSRLTFLPATEQCPEDEEGHQWIDDIPGGQKVNNPRHCVHDTQSLSPESKDVQVDSLLRYGDGRKSEIQRDTETTFSAYVNNRRTEMK